jgi:hypothetical protein
MGSFGILVLRALARGMRTGRCFSGETGMGIRSDLRDSTGSGSSLKRVGAK